MTEETANVQKPCAHCLENSSLKDGLCDRCTAFPRCEICEVIFGLGFSKPSKKNPKRCASCLNFEETIKEFCFICGTTLPMFYPPRSSILRMFTFGNCCRPCSGEVTKSARRGRKTGVYTDYLSLVRKSYERGEITREQWEYAKLMNLHDIV